MKNLSLSKFEALDGALSTHLRFGDFENTADPRGHIRSFNVLFDTAVDCGMSFDHDDVRGWAAEQVTRCLLAA